MEGKPREDILGMPHNEDGCEEAKKILEKTYGKDIKIHKALIKELEGLEAISSTHNVHKIHEYYNKLTRIVRALGTMKKLDSAKSYVYTLVDKLGPVKENLIQKDDDWENWDLLQLVENLEIYVDRYPLPNGESTGAKRRANEHQADWRQWDKIMQANTMDRGRGKQNNCVFYELSNHKSADCHKVLDLAHRREIVKRKKLCFNCTGFGHTASNCRSRGCRKCDQRHHTSLYDSHTANGEESKSQQSEMGKRAIDTSTTLHATITSKVNGVPACIMIDSGASSSYICIQLITQLHLKSVSMETRNIEQMYGTVKRRMENFKVNIQSNAIEGFSLNINCINGEKDLLTYLPNPKVKELKKKYSRFRNLRFCDEDAQEERLPIHMTLGAADYQSIKTMEPPKLGQNPDVDPGAEFTMLGWTLAGRMAESSLETENILLMVSSQDEFEQMCSIEVFRLSDTDKRLDEEFHENYKKNVKRLNDGTYMTRLPWKEDIVQLPANKELAVARLYNTTKRLEKSRKLEEYEEAMKDQTKEGILEKVPKKPSGEIVHYVPDQEVIREQAESTKMRIVYNCSAKSSMHVPSLNDCLKRDHHYNHLFLIFY